MKLVIGLGNPGAQYEKTRHNIGWMVLDELARRHNIDIAKRLAESRVGDGLLGGETKIVLAKPQTFMNDSGRAAQSLCRWYNVETAQMIAVCDDLNLPVGKLRLRASGSDGGQNGLKSIAQSLNSREFARLRFGIGEPPARERQERGTASFVLRPFDKSEIEDVQLSIQRAADCIETWARDGVSVAMNRFN